MKEPAYFCPQCGPLRGGASYDGPPIDEDGCCGGCGASTCTWPDLVEHLRDEGYELVREPALAAVIDRVRESSSTEGREPADLSGVVHRAYFHMMTGEPAMPCKRTYPLDPTTAEDPCEECGRDERKHEIGPRVAAPPSPAEKLSDSE